MRDFEDDDDGDDRENYQLSGLRRQFLGGVEKSAGNHTQFMPSDTKSNAGAPDSHLARLRRSG